jgi:hypothetical protein
MSELEMANEAYVETEEFTDELSDEALDREGAKYCFGTSLPICASFKCHIPDR